MAPSHGSGADSGEHRTPGWRSKLTGRRGGKWALPVAVSLTSALVVMTLTAVASATSASTSQASGRSGVTAAGRDGGNGGSSLVREGKQTFRFDTFGDEAFWGGTLQLHKAIEGAANGGVGPGVSPKTALALGLKVDVDALPQSRGDGIHERHGRPRTTRRRRWRC